MGDTRDGTLAIQRACQDGLYALMETLRMQDATFRLYSGPRAWLRHYRYGLIALATTLLLLLPMGFMAAQAQMGYPPFLDPYLNDYGQVVERSDAATIRATLQQFKQQTGVQVVVVTVNSVQSYGTGDRTIESFATNLFNRWGVGDRTRNDGILLLVAPGDRKLRIELGSGYARSYDAVAQAIIDDQILPHFREGRISQGTVSGVSAIVSRFNPSSPPPAGIGLIGVPTDLREVPPSGQIAFAGGLVALITGVPVVAQWRRNRKRSCPRCQTQMERLDEHADDKFLNPGQRREESLNAVNYDTWQCPRCGYHQTLKYSNMFSRYRRCPHCDNKTLEVEATTTRQPTHSYEGEKRIDEHCRHCSHQRTYHRSIPRLTHHHSSGNGGGGHSSGGGASGSW